MQYHVRDLHTYLEEPVNHLKTKMHCSLCKEFVLPYFSGITLGLQTAAGSSILLTFLSYEDVSMHIHQCYLDNVDNTDREEPFELQFVKVSPAQFVSESLKYNVLRSLKGKYVSNTIQSSVSNPVGKSFEKHSSSALSAIEIDMQLSTSSPIKK